MGVIQRLDEHLSNMIAAGEVIERPSAIVKELVENALDAHAKHIYIKMIQGGIESLEIMDDGLGMDPQDAQMAFERHSTSKIKTQEDLFAPRTLGFRGEALPSIASVCDVHMQSVSNTIGTAIHMSYGKLIKAHPHEGPNGTRFLITGLFLKTPARLKYLKSPKYEASIIAQVIERFALSRPDVAFKLLDEDKELINTSGSNQLIDALAAVYGNVIARSSFEMAFENYDYRLQLAWVHPQHHRSNNKGIQLFINQRMVRSYPLLNAILEAYKDYLPAHRYPICVCHVFLDPQLVDVNVHPSKWEVKLSKESQLTQFITESLQGALKQAMRPAEARRVIKDFEVEDQLPFFDINNYQPLQQSLEVFETVSNPQFPSLDLIGQMHGRYILASSPESLYLIDQHAAKERINYELILSSLKTEHVETLLMPLHIEVSPSFMERFDEFETVCRNLLIEVERFSINTYLVRSIPVWLKSLQLEGFMHDLQALLLEKKLITEVSLRDHIIANVACHRSVRFNQVLSTEDMHHIIKELSACEQPYHCPHGRPTFVQLSTRQLWNDFER